MSKSSTVVTHSKPEQADNSSAAESHNHPEGSTSKMQYLTPVLECNAEISSTSKVSYDTYLYQGNLAKTFSIFV